MSLLRDLAMELYIQVYGFSRAQELCESRGGRPGLLNSVNQCLEFDVYYSLFLAFSLSLLLPLALVACLLPHATSVAQCDRRQKKTWPQRVLPGMPSFPSSEDFDNLARSLNGSLLTAQDASYTKACSMHNLRVVAKPHAIVYVASLEDVQKVNRNL